MNMVLASIVLVLSFLHFAQGQRTCYSCSDTTYGDTFRDNCYDNLTNTDSTCVGSLNCMMTFTTNDGLVTSISRGCTTLSTHGLQCFTLLSSGINVETTTCDLVCGADNCNSMRANNLRSCDPACGSPGSGYCNYFTGQCICSLGYTGTNCATAPTATPTQMCLQCDDATAPGCTSALTSTLCSDPSHNQCTASRTTLYDASNNVAQTVVTRGCTSSSSVRNDECTFSTPADFSLSGFIEYTCTRTCTTNGCNTFTPDGTGPGPLYCCTDSACSNRVRCPTNQGYCYSRVTYRSSASQPGVTYNEVQGYQLISIDRGCTSTPVTSQCTDTPLDSSTGVVTTCEETCQTHGCNDGWPHRPKCLFCDSFSGSVAAGTDSCLYNPGSARSCPEPYHQYCVYTDQGKSGKLTSQLADNRGGYPRSISRGCSATNIGTSCSEFQSLDTTFQQCNKTCNTDGCNHGMGGSSRPATSFIVLLITSFLAYVTQST